MPSTLHTFRKHQKILMVMTTGLAMISFVILGAARSAHEMPAPLVVIARMLRPIIAALNWAANCIVRLLGVEPRDEVASAFTADEVQSIVERSSAEGTLDDTSGCSRAPSSFPSTPRRMSWFRSAPW